MFYIAFETFTYYSDYSNNLFSSIFKHENVSCIHSLCNGAKVLFSFPLSSSFGLSQNLFRAQMLHLASQKLVILEILHALPSTIALLFEEESYVEILSSFIETVLIT